MRTYFSLITTLLLLTGFTIHAAPLVYEGTEGVGKGKHIVFIANDHEYRSEETCPFLAQLIAKRHGFKCTVLFGIDEEGHIKPGAEQLPHLEVLKEADIVVFFTRFMNLPKEQVEHLVAYLERGGPIIGLRTSTHAFKGQGSGWEKLNYNYEGEDYEGGIGKQVFGNTWHKETGQSHYGKNHTQGGTYTPVASAKDHPIMTGVPSFHGYNGAYKSQPPSDATPLIEVQVLNTFHPSEDKSSQPIVNAGWTRDYYRAPSGEKKEARVMYSSIGPSEDFLDPKARRFMLNSILWGLGLEEKITPELNVDLVSPFQPSAYCTGSFYRVGVKPSELAGLEAPIMPPHAKFAGVSDNAPIKRIQVLKNREKLLKKIQELHPKAILEQK